MDILNSNLFNFFRYPEPLLRYNQNLLLFFLDCKLLSKIVQPIFIFMDKKCGKLGTRKDSSSLFFAIESRDLGISDSKRLRVKRRKITLQETDTSHIKNEKIEQKVSKTILQIMYSSSKLNENKEYIIVDHL